MSLPQRPGSRLRRVALCAQLLAGLAAGLLSAGGQAQPAVSRAVEVPPPKGWTPDTPLFAAEEEPVAGSKRAAEMRGVAPTRPVTARAEQATSAVAGKRDAPRGAMQPRARATTTAVAEPRVAGAPQQGAASLRNVTNKAPREPEKRQAGRAITRADLRGAPASDRNSAAAPHSQRVANRAQHMQPAPRSESPRSGAVKARTTERAGAHHRPAQAGPGPAPRQTTPTAVARQRPRAGQPAVPAHKPSARAANASMKAAGPKPGMATKPAAVETGTSPSRHAQPLQTRRGKGKTAAAPQRKGAVQPAHQKARR